MLRSLKRVRVTVAVAAVVALAGCSLDKQGAPGLSGPSTLGRSLTLSAAPDRILYDGVSQTVVTATIRDASGKGEANVSLRWQADVVVTTGGTTTLTGIPLDPAPQVTVTNASGQTSTVVKSPLSPTLMPNGTVGVRITATPVGDDASQLAPGVDAKTRTIVVELVPMSDGSAPNRVPVVDFTISPPSATVNQFVTFDGSLTRDEGEVCGDRCSYVWDFGSAYPNRTGRVVSNQFTSPATITVTLFVTDERGGTGSKTQTVRVNGPAAPVAAFTVTPVTPAVNVAAKFDAVTSTVGQGATIVQYSWDFGDGTTGTGRVLNHTYTDISLVDIYPVTLTITDDLGRTSRITTLVTVVP